MYQYLQGGETDITIGITNLSKKGIECLSKWEREWNPIRMMEIDLDEWRTLIGKVDEEQFHQME